MSPPNRIRKVVVSGTPSDSHTWNLVFLQLYLEELGHRVVNLGPCVPAELLAAECAAHTPDLLVLSSVNGHGYRDGLTAVTRLRQRPELAGLAVVIGGKLGVVGHRDRTAAIALREAGCLDVFDDTDLDRLRLLIDQLPAARPQSAVPAPDLPTPDARVLAEAGRVHT
ncbi:cobalamin-dependent protein [Streptomyces tauricus]|uniref:cobalamin-dependent protein n=1 Tax=Streptomyces TaxID=1883 RepID=UPI0033B177F9